jgi:hypothetical protein
MLIIIPTIKELVNSKSWLPPKEERMVTRRDRREKRGLGSFGFKFSLPPT